MLAPMLLVLLSTLVGSIWTNESESSHSILDVKPTEKRYSEAILASDYSKYVDTMMSKNFVDWLIAAKRTSRNGESLEGVKRDINVVPTTPRSPNSELQSAKNFQVWLLKHQGKRSCTRSVDPVSSLLGDQLIQELLDRIHIATEVMNQRTQDPQ
ncbi:glucagon-2-like [Rhincodon typus]|uniref:glucagon-2-like n=1 Tax=Rhincodon typus TaxID=259920 RepID=UPI00202FDCB4|nr:glucagon-2-like [Rhincodon typus]XP_048470623.1 glucagon-2-like [Rhincodon typus]